MIALRCALGICLPLVVFISVLYSNEPKKTETAHSTGHFLDRLSHPRFLHREEASKQLVKRGEAVLDHVRKLSRGTTDYDLHVRCEKVIRDILRNCSPSKSTGMKLVLIDSGDFMMGSPAGERNRRPDEMEHAVQISEPFVMGVTEVTQDEFDKVMGFKPSWFTPTGEGRAKIQVTDTSRYPVENVTWFDAIAFCNGLSKKDGYQPYYKMTDIRKRDATTIEATVTIEGGNGYHLPTEAQWEYAARATSKRAYHFGTSNRGTDANTRPGPSVGYGGDPDFAALNRTARVGAYPANAWGLVDVCGNVGEWCWDFYDKDYYTYSVEKDPTGPPEGKHRVARGGSWMLAEGSCRSASRHFFTPDMYNSSCGFRVIRQP